MVAARELEDILLEELGFANRPSLKSGDDIPWPTGRRIPDIDSAYFLNNVPVAYFSRLSEIDPDRIRKLHQNVWSQSKAPLLFVTLPNEIRVYNGYDTPVREEIEFDTPQRLLQKLSELTDHLTARREIQKTLVEENHYERVYLETGAFWNTSDGQQFNNQTRADMQLVESMGKLRDLLLEAGLSKDVAYVLLGRSIFIRYLEDRGALSKEWIAQATGGNAEEYQKALGAGRRVTYQLFNALSQRFNGDLFPVEANEDEVEQDHLQILLSFLSRTDLETGQLSFWPYNFEFIPIELISHIYDTFIVDQRESGAYYTPPMLADFILEETMGDDVIEPDMTVLDPACGSGIFLVGAYRRLVQVWRRSHEGELSPEILSQILTQNIFGVDKKTSAVRIAAFSLYLEILNHLTNEQIQQELFRFPALQGQNLLAGDFFAEEIDEQFSKRKFDRIIGNLPWGKGTLTNKAKKWLTQNDYAVGGKQIAPAFMLRAPSFVSEDGELALLAPAKSTIFVTSGPHQEFRDSFFTSFDVRAVVNFSALVYELFTGSISPAVAFFYDGAQPDLNGKLVYAVPKPSPQSRHLKAIVLDTTEVKYLNRGELLDKPHLWKIALWGTPRDAALIERLSSKTKLANQIEERGWKMGQGFQVNGPGKKHPAAWLTGQEMVPTTKMRPYALDKSTHQVIKEESFYRRSDPELFKAPLALIGQSQCAAAYSDTDITYKHKITGVAGNQEDKWLLMWLVAYINSPLSKYYHFLTSMSWAVERGNIIQKEYEEMPFLIPDKNDPKLQELVDLVKELRRKLTQEGSFYWLWPKLQRRVYEAQIHQLVFDIHGLHPVEQQQVMDTLTYSLGFFDWAKRKTRKPNGTDAVKMPSLDMLRAYAKIFSESVTSMLRIKNQTLNATVYRNGAPLTVVSFDLASLDRAQEIQVVDEHHAMRTKLRELDELLLVQKTPSMYMRRHVRIYDDDSVSLVRPSEQRFWTQSQARADADAFLAEMSSF